VTIYSVASGGTVAEGLCASGGGRQRLDAVGQVCCGCCTLVLHAASSSRSQITVRSARAPACLTWKAESVGVHWRSLMSAVIVTHLVTRLLAIRCRDRLHRRSSGVSLRSVALELSARTDVSVDDRLALPHSPIRHARYTGWPIGQTASMRSIGASSARCSWFDCFSGSLSSSQRTCRSG
jgi:hypothetical protein